MLSRAPLAGPRCFRRPRWARAGGAVRLGNNLAGGEEEVAVIDRSQVHEGMVVRSSDGRELGRVLTCGERSFVVEKGFYFATDYVARYDDVTSVSRDEIRLSRPQQELAQGERTFTREGAFGESFTFGIGSSLERSPSEPSALAEDEEAQRHRGVRGDEDEEGRQHSLSGADGLPPTYGDEGGGGLL
jgi:hypothetical protein